MLALLFFRDTATTEIYTLSLHDALPISAGERVADPEGVGSGRGRPAADPLAGALDRKSTRLNSSHLGISYAVFCLKKKIMASAMPRLMTQRTLSPPLHHAYKKSKFVKCE